MLISHWLRSLKVGVNLCVCQSSKVQKFNSEDYQPTNLLWLRAKSQRLIARNKPLANHQLTKPKFQMTNSKIQIKSKFQISNSKQLSVFICDFNCFFIRVYLCSSAVQINHLTNYQLTNSKEED
jgi:predicted peroxiredoxin